MKILVDTSVWSIAFRRKKKVKKDNEIVEKLSNIISESRAVMMGVIRQELLSGLSDHKQFVFLRDKLRGFEDIQLTIEDYELAADMYNICRRKGVQGSHIDYLICAAAENHHLAIFTVDQDFTRYAKHLSLRIY